VSNEKADVKRFYHDGIRGRVEVTCLCDRTFAFKVPRASRAPVDIDTSVTLVICSQSDEPHPVCSHPNGRCVTPKRVRSGNGEWQLRRLFDEHRALRRQLEETVNVIQNFGGCMGNPCWTDKPPGPSVFHGQCVPCNARALLRQVSR